MDEKTKKQLQRFRREIRVIVRAVRSTGADGEAEFGPLLEKASNTAVYLQVKESVGRALAAHQSRYSSRAAVAASSAA